MPKITQTDKILMDVYETLGLSDCSVIKKYDHLTSIVTELERRNVNSPINPKTTGTISERLCELGLKAILKSNYSRMPQHWRWLADFSIFGSPFNILVSVKSFTAKERLISSGSGSLLTPTIGWTLLKSGSEFSEDRTKAYVFAGFIAIYLPRLTLEDVSKKSKQVCNLNGTPLLRDVTTFHHDLRTALIRDRLDVKKI